MQFPSFFFFKKKLNAFFTFLPERVRQHQPYPVGRGQADRGRPLRLGARPGRRRAAGQDLEGLRLLPGRAHHRAGALRPIPPEGRAVRRERRGLEQGDDKLPSPIMFKKIFCEKRKRKV